MVNSVQELPFQWMEKPLKSEVPDPTAHTAFEAMAVTPSTAVCSPVGLRTTDHLVPFQCSVNVWPMPSAPREMPTAQTSPEETTATSFSWFAVAPGLGDGTWVHAVPFQWRMSVFVALKEFGWYWPTAQMSVGEAAATPNMMLTIPGTGVPERNHPVPSQCSIRG